MSTSLNIGEILNSITSASNKAEVVAIIIVNGEGSKESIGTNDEMPMDEYPHERPQGDVEFEKNFFMREFMEAIFGKKKRTSVAGSGGSGGGSGLDNAILQGPFTP